MSTLTVSGQREPEKIVILRALQLGDMLNAVPALRALRAGFPHAQITLVGLPWARAFVERYHHLLDDFVDFPGYPGLPEREPDMSGFPAFVHLMQESVFDLAIQMHGSGRITNHLVHFWGAKRMAGFYEAGAYCPDQRTFLEYPEHAPERWRHLRLMEFLGMPLKGDELEFPLRAQDLRELEALLHDSGLVDDYICIHPGARKTERRWPITKFAQVADGLAGLGYQIVLTGSQAEARLVDSLAVQMTRGAVNLAGRTTLGGLAALLSNARLLVSNDTGVSHLAAAVRAPSVILFSAPDHERWAPANRQLHKTVLDASNVTASEVLEQARRHLAEVYAGVR